MSTLDKRIAEGKACPFCHAVGGHTLVPHPGVRLGDVPAGTLTHCPNELVERGQFIRCAPTGRPPVDRKDSNPARMLGGTVVYCLVFIGLALLAWLR